MYSCTAYLNFSSAVVHVPIIIIGTKYLVDPNGSDDSAENCRMDPVPVLVRVPDSG